MEVRGTAYLIHYVEVRGTAYLIHYGPNALRCFGGRTKSVC
jgi:hypothetical protein